MIGERIRLRQGYDEQRSGLFDRKRLLISDFFKSRVKALAHAMVNSVLALP